MTRFQFPPAAPRREFIRDAGRWLALAGLGLLGLLAVMRGSPWAGSGCIAGNTCGGCPREPGCQLPRARAAAARRKGPVR